MQTYGYDGGCAAIKLTNGNKKEKGEQVIRGEYIQHVSEILVIREL